MRLILIMLLFIALSMPCFAEEMFIKVGVAASDGTLVIGGGEKSVTWGATFGLGTEFELGGLLFGGEMIYVKKGITSEKTFENLSFSYYQLVGNTMELQTVYFGQHTLKYNYSYEYVEFPVYAIFRPLNSLSLYGGVSFSLLLQATLTIDGVPPAYDELTEEYLDIKMSEQEINGYTNKTDIQVLGGFRYSYDRYFIDFRYSQGLRNIADEDLNKDSVKMRYASICFGVKL